MSSMNLNDYRVLKMNEELLRRIERLETKVDELQNRNQKLERMMRESFISFKFDTSEEERLEQERIERSRRIRSIFSNIR